MEMQNQMNEITAKVSEYLAQLIGNPESAVTFSEGPIDAIEAEFGGEDLSELNVAQAIEGAYAQAGDAVAAAGGEAPAPVAPPMPEPAEGGDVTLDQLVKIMSENVNEVYQDSDEIGTTIGQNLESHGTIHGNMVQESYSSEVNATGEGSLAVGDDMAYSDVQTQTGDGVQVGGSNYGVANVGDNSGQMAGGNASAGNITSGDNANVASQGSAAGDGAINMAGASIHDSAVEFGEGSNTQQDTFIEDSYNTAAQTTNVDTDSTYDTHDQYTDDSYNTATATDNSTEDVDYTYDDHSQYSDDDTATIDQHAGHDADAHDIID